MITRSPSLSAALLMLLTGILSIPVTSRADAVFFGNKIQTLKARRGGTGVTEPPVRVFHRGRLIDRREQRVIEGYLKTGTRPNRPLLFADIPANTYLRLTYAKSDGIFSGTLATSVVGCHAFRSPSGELDLTPVVSKATIHASGKRQGYRSVLLASFPGLADLVLERRLLSAKKNRTAFRLESHFTAVSDIPLATGTTFVGNDRFRILTVSSMYAGSTRFDADFIRILGADGQIVTLDLREGVSRDAHLFENPVAVGTWFELVKGRDSTWNPDSPTIRVNVGNRDGLRLGVQGFLTSSTDPNEDSLSVWLEWLDAPDVVPAGTSHTITFEVIATPPR